MVERKSKIPVVVASQYFLTRLGVKTMLSVIGVESEMKSILHFSNLKEELAKDKRSTFWVVCQDILSPEEIVVLDNILERAKEKKVMLIGSSELPKYKNLYFVDQEVSKSKMIDEFQCFFYDRKSSGEDESVLTEREVEVLKKVAQGYANKEIADKLFISINTVITHRKNITEKLGIKTIAGLTVYALMNNVINAEDVQF